MKLSKLLVSAILALFTAVGAQAAPFGFATDSGLDLYTVDFGTGTATLIGNTGVFLEGIALAPNGTLFGTTSGGELYSIDTTTAAATLIGDTGLGNIEGLDFEGNTLLGVNFDSTPSLYSIDLTTAVPTLVATANTSTGAVRSMADLNATTVLLRGDAGGNTLFSMDLITGAVTAIGPQANTIFGMDFLSDGNLYGLSNSGLVFSINTGTGALTQIGDTGDQFWLSLTNSSSSGAVPEPSTLALIALASVGLAYRRRRY